MHHKKGDVVSDQRPHMVLCGEVINVLADDGPLMYRLRGVTGSEWTVPARDTRSAMPREVEDFNAALQRHRLTRQCAQETAPAAERG